MADEIREAPNLGDAFKKAHDHAAEKSPTKLVKTYELTPGGMVEQIVHTRLDEAAKASAMPQKRNDAAKEFKKHLLLKREFNKVRGHEHGRDR